MSFDSDVKEAVEKLKALDKNMNRALPVAAEAGARVMVREARRRAKGRLKKSIRDRARGDLSTQAGKAVHQVHSTSPLANIIEYGTSGHEITPKKKKALAFDGIVVMRVNHPGTKKQPFMRPAWDESQAAIAREMGETIKAKDGI